MDGLSEVKDVILAQGRQIEAWQADESKRIDELFEELKALKRPNLGSGGGGANADRKALNEAIRQAALGDESGIKRMSAGSGADGGYLVVPTMDDAVRQIRALVSPLSALVRNIDVSTGDEVLMPFFRGTLDTGWVAENSERPETAPLDAGMHRIALHEVYANPRISQKLLDVANYDVGALLVDQIAHGLAQAEAAAIHNGTGVARPRGFTTYSTAAAADNARTWGVIEHIPTGASGAFHTTKTDCLVQAVDALAPQYRPNARWVMSRATAGVVRRLKEATTDRYLWEPSLQAGQPDYLLGYPVTISRKGVAVDLPREWTLEQALGVNAAALAFDGITALEKDGTVIFTEKTSAAFKAHLGEECARLKPEDAAAMAAKLVALV